MEEWTDLAERAVLALESIAAELMRTRLHKLQQESGPPLRTYQGVPKGYPGTEQPGAIDDQASQKRRPRRPPQAARS